MRSLFAKVMLWSLGTFALSLVAFWAISRTLDRHGPPKGDPIPRLLEMVEDDLCRAYDEGGPPKLAAGLRRLDGYLPGGAPLDRSARTRPRDRSRSVRVAQARPIFTRAASHGRRPDDLHRPAARPAVSIHFGREALVRAPNILPYYGAIVLVIVLMGWILAAHLAAPLRRLRRLVDQFGHGDLAIRSHSTRKDEIGELSRSFDEMAGRIETLLNAERRLLQDVSHELRSPLTRLDVAVDLATTSEDPGEYLGRIKRDIGRLAVLVNELLQLTRAEGDPSAQNLEGWRWTSCSTA